MNMSVISVDEIYNKDEKLKREDVNALINWMEKQPHLPQVTELQLILFLQSCYYSNEAAKNTIDTYFTVKTLCPDIFGSKDVTSDEEIQKAMKTMIVSPLPKTTATGELLIFCKLMDTNPDNYNLGPQLNLFDMVTLNHLHQKGPYNGVHIVMDMKGVVFSHFLKLNPVFIRKFLFYLQEGMPIRLKSIHFVNIVSFMDKILALMKPFMKKELIESLYLHIDPESLFKQLPKELFPHEYGGSCESSQILQEKIRCQVNDNKEFFKFLTCQTVDESRRQGKPKSASDIFGVEGSFKKLEVD